MCIHRESPANQIWTTQPHLRKAASPLERAKKARAQCLRRHHHTPENTLDTTRPNHYISLPEQHRVQRPLPLDPWQASRVDAIR